MTILAAAMLTAAALPATALPFQCSDDFSGYAPGSAAEAGVEVVAGAWEVRNGGFWTRGGDGDVAYPLGCAESASQTMAATIRVDRRTDPRGWATAGIALRQNRENYWALHLVESPAGQRYAELGETYGGQWQAQAAGPTALKLIADTEQQFDWQVGHDYRLEARVSDDEIRGRVIDAATGAVMFERAWAWGDAPAIRYGRLALMANGLEVLVSRVEAKGEMKEVAWRPRPDRRRVWVLDEALPGADRELVELIAGALEADGLVVTRVSAQEAAAPDALEMGTVDLLVLPQARRLPVAMREPLHHYLSSGGRVFAFGAPLGEEFLFHRDDAWVSHAEALSRVTPDTVLFDFGEARLDDWTHAVAPAGQPASWHVTRGPDGEENAVEIDVPRLDTWDTFVSRPIDQPFSGAANLTTIWAKGSERTTGMVVEWRETDGSRWIASVSLTREWKRYALHPNEFHYWPDAQAKGRGGAGDRFHPANAHQMSVGLAMSHASLDRGPQRYWIGEIGVAADPAGEYDITPLLLESLSPDYKIYPVDQIARARARGDQAIVAADVELPGPLTGVSALSRERGLGLRNERLGRWIPLVECYDDNDVRRGTLAWLYLSFTTPYRRAAWGSLGITDQRYLRQHFDRIRPILTAASRALCEGLFLRKAGVDRFAYFPADGMTRGAQITSLNAEEGEQEVAIRQRVSPRGAAPAQPPTESLVRAAYDKDAVVVTGTADAHGLAPGDYEIATELVRDARIIDRISYPFSVVEEPHAPPDQIVRTEGEQFVLGGKPWYPHGVNFWPSCATGLQLADYAGHWLDPSRYDPQVVERDLDICQSLGMNAISIQLMRRGHTRTVVDFLERAGRRGIKCNIYLDGGHPLHLNLERLTDLIKLGHFAGNPNVWAYDVAWEPHAGQYKDRRPLDPAWRQWIIDQYGSVEEAEADWGFAVPRDEAGEVTGPSQDQILNDGDWRVMVAAYRRFLDDHISRGYNRVRRAIRAIDPDHLIGARTGWGGTGTEWADAGMPFDLRSGAKHLDFVSPEGYGMKTDWDEARTYGFTTAYGRWAGNGKPVFWSEFGASLFPEYDATRIETQRKIYENMYRVILESGANGSAGWWYPGGRRLGEESDYGVVSPDGTPRASAFELQKYAPTITGRATLPEPDQWITIDRDLHARGYSQVMKRDVARYLDIIDDGQFPGVRTEGTGTTSADVPKVAVGNRPWTGKNPHKYLNAELNWVKVRGTNGEWVGVENGGTAEIPAEHALRFEFSIGNTGEAGWLPGEAWLEWRDVYRTPLRAFCHGRVDRFSDFHRKGDDIGDPPLPMGQAGELNVVLRMAAVTGGFGETFRFTLKAVTAK